MPSLHQFSRLRFEISRLRLRILAGDFLEDTQPDNKTVMGTPDDRCVALDLRTLYNTLAHIRKLCLFLLNHVVRRRQSHVFKLIDMEYLEPHNRSGGWYSGSTALRNCHVRTRRPFKLRLVRVSVDRNVKKLRLNLFS